MAPDMRSIPGTNSTTPIDLPQLMEHPQMEVIETKLQGVVRMHLRRFDDGRGWFSETYSHRTMQSLGFGQSFVQDNHSYSARTGTVRGLHYQSPPSAQAKLIRVGHGAIKDVAVDVRRGSPTYGHWVAEELSADNRGQLLIPRGFLHGFITLTPDVEVLYKVDSFYDPTAEGSVRFDDPTLGIDWGLGLTEIIQSDKDAAATSFADFHSPFQFNDEYDSKNICSTNQDKASANKVVYGALA